MESTKEQLDAVRKVSDAVEALNATLDDAGQRGVFVILDSVEQFGERNRTYYVSKAELRVSVIPSRLGFEPCR